MGMFDTIQFEGDGAPRCAAGHEVRSCQTKDLDNTLATVYVFGGRAFCAGAGPRHGDGETRSARVEDEALVLTRVENLPRLARTAELLIYGHCEECQPVLMLGGPGAAYWDLVQERLPVLEWLLTLHDGHVAALVPHRVQTREEVRAELLAGGVEVLDDDDRLARRHFARRAGAQSGRALSTG